MLPGRFHPAGSTKGNNNKTTKLLSKLTMKMRCPLVLPTCQKKKKKTQFRLSSDNIHEWVSTSQMKPSLRVLGYWGGMWCRHAQIWSIEPGTALNLIEGDCVEAWPRLCSPSCYWSTKWKRLSSVHLLLSLFCSLAQCSCVRPGVHLRWAYT